MFVKKNKSHKGILLTFTIGYREIGYLDELKKQYNDPITHFKEITKQRSNEEISELTIKNLNNKTIDKEGTKNLGYVILKKIYKELGISELLAKKTKAIKN